MRIAFKSAFIYLACQFSYVFASPEGGVVAQGGASISGQGSNQVTINQSTNKAIINWQTFDVGNGQSVTFNTPGANAATLNRISGNASQILGNVTSNGQLWLINPNGIMFGKNAQINVAGLVASTMNISDKDFLSGHYKLTQTGSTLAQISNAGHINADGGYVAMLAPQIENTGVIEAKLGTVAMGAGTEATLAFQGNQLLNFAVGQGANVPMYDENGQPVAALNQAGKIEANGGQVLLTADSINSMLDQSINVTGVIQADTVEDRPGKIVLLAKGNAILENAQLSAQGGKVEVIGQNVGLFNNTSIQAQGGEIRIGKDATDLHAFEANATVIDSSVALNAHFIETSGNYLNVQSTHIIADQWLLDPYNLTISSASGSSITPSNPFEPTGAGSNLDIETLLSALNTGNVTVQTAGTSGGEAGDITLLNSLTYLGTNALTLDAVGAVSFDSTAALSLGGALNITAGGNIIQQGALISVAGATTLTSGGDITLNANGDNDFNTVSVTAAHNVYLKDQNDLTLGASTVSGLLSVQITGDLTQNGALISTSPSIGTDYEVNLSAGGKITQNGSITTAQFGDIQLASGGDLIQSAGASLTSGDTEPTVIGINLDSYVGNIQQAGQISLNGAQLNITAHAGNVTQASTAGIVSAHDIYVTGNNNYLDGVANHFTGILNVYSNGSPMNVRVTNSDYITQDLSAQILIHSPLNSFALTLPNYNPNAGTDTSLAAFINGSVLPATLSSSNFDLSLNLAAYTSALQVGDDQSGASTHLIDLTQLTGSTGDMLHNLTVKTAGDLSLVYNNNSATTPLTVNAVDLESSNGNVSVTTGSSDNKMEINGGLTLATDSGAIVVSGFDSTSQIQTPSVTTTATGVATVALSQLTGVDGGSFALNMTENGPSTMPTLIFGSGVAQFNSFSLTAPSFVDSGNLLATFLNNYILNNVANAKQFDLNLSLASNTTAIAMTNPGAGIGVPPYINLAALNGAIHNLTVDSAGDIHFTQAATDTFAANNIDLESTAGNLAVNATQSNSRIAVNQALTLAATGESSTINVNNTGAGSVDTPILNLSGNNSTVNLSNLSENSSFALNATEESASALSSFTTINSGKFDSFSLTASNYNPGSSGELVSLLNSVVDNEAKASTFDLTLNLAYFTADLDLGFDVLHNLSVSTAGNVLLSPSSTMQANRVDLSTTGSHGITLSNTNASQEVSVTTGSGAVSVSHVQTPIVNTTTNGGSIQLDTVQGNSTAGSSFALNMTENGTAMPDLSYGGSSAPAFSSFSLTAPNFNSGDGSLETFVNQSILAYATSPSTFDLNLNLASDTHTLVIGNVDGTINLSALDNQIHNLTIASQGELDFTVSGGNTLTANTVTLSTSGSQKDISVSAQNSDDHIVFNTLNSSTEGGVVTVNPNSSSAFALNMTEGTNKMPDVVWGGTGTNPILSRFSLTAPLFNQAAGTLETWINTVLTYSTSPASFDLALDLAGDTYAIEIGNDTSGDYINLNTSPLNNTIGNVSIKSAGEIDFINNGGGSINASSIDLETSGMGKTVSVAAVNSGDAINVSNISLKALGIGGGASISDGGGNNVGSINTSIVNLETNQGTSSANGVTSDFALNLTEDSDATPEFVLGLGGGSLTRLTVNFPIYNLGNDTVGETNPSLTVWMNNVLSNLPVVLSGFSLSVNTPVDGHTIQMGYGGAGNFINLSNAQDSSFNPVINFGDLSLQSAGEVDLIAHSASLSANSADLETTGLLSNVNVSTDSDHTVTLTSDSNPLTLVASGGGNITVNNSPANDVSAALVNTTTAGGQVDLSSVTGSAAGISGAYALNMTDHSGWAPTLTTASNALQSFSYTAPHLSWNINNGIQSLLNTVLSNETTSNPGSNFNLSWNTTGLRDILNMADLDETEFTVDNMNLTSLGAIQLSSVTVYGNLNVDNSAGFQDVLVLGSMAVTGTATLISGGSITDGGGHTGSVSAGITNLTAVNGINLSNTANRFGIVSANNTSTGDITLDDGNENGLTIAALNNSAGSGNIYVIEYGAGLNGVALTVNGNITTGGALSLEALNGGGIVETEGGSITTGYSTTLQATGNRTGYIHLMGDNQFSAVAATIDGSSELGGVALNDINTSGLTVDTIDTTDNGEVPAGADVSISTAGTLQVVEKIRAGSGNVNLTASSGGINDNDGVGAIQASGTTTFNAEDGTSAVHFSNTSFTPGEGNELGTVAVTNAGAVTLNNNGALTVSGITAHGDVNLYADGAGYDLPDQTLNIQGAIISNGGAINLVDTSDAINVAADLTAGMGKIFLFNKGGGINQTAGTMSSLSTDSDAIELLDQSADPINLAGTLSASAGGILVNALGEAAPVTISGALNADTITVETGGQLNLAVSHAMNASGNAVLSASLFNNTGGSEAVVTGGYWNIYLSSSLGNTYGGLTSSGTVWGTPYNVPAPAPTSNLYIYAEADPNSKTVTVSAPASVNPGNVQQTVENNLPVLGRDGQILPFINAQAIQDNASGINENLNEESKE